MTESKRHFITHSESRIRPSASQLAEVFWAMDEEEQGEFFRTLGEISEGKLPFQLQAVINFREFSPEAKRVMQMIGEYGDSQ